MARARGRLNRASARRTRAYRLVDRARMVILGGMHDILEAQIQADEVFTHIVKRSQVGCLWILERQ